MGVAKQPRREHVLGVNETQAPVPIGRRIEQFLKDADKTPGWLADTAGLERSTVLRAIRGERQPTADTLAVLAPALGVTLAQLVAGTDAAGRVKDVEELIPRRHYQAALDEVFAYEAKANDALRRAREHEEVAKQDRAAVREARAEAEGMRRELARLEFERNEAMRRAASSEHDARRYRDGLEKAVQEVARMQEQLREIGQAVDESRRTGRVTAILASIAAAVSVAQFLTNDEPAARDESSPPQDQKKHGAKTRRTKRDPINTNE